MASLIVHGDLQAGEPPLNRPLYVRPVMVFDAASNAETTPPDRLPLDVVYLAVRRLLEGDGAEPASAPSVVVINLSLGHPIMESAETDPLVRAVDRAVG